MCLSQVEKTIKFKASLKSILLGFTRLARLLPSLMDCIHHSPFTPYICLCVCVFSERERERERKREVKGRGSRCTAAVSSVAGTPHVVVGAAAKKKPQEVEEEDEELRPISAHPAPFSSMGLFHPRSRHMVYNQNEPSCQLQMIKPGKNE